MSTPINIRRRRSERDSNGHLRCPICRRREDIMNEAPKRCPICGKHVDYSGPGYIDRPVHADGSSNRPCWAEIMRNDSITEFPALKLAR